MSPCAERVWICVRARLPFAMGCQSAVRLHEVKNRSANCVLSHALVKCAVLL